MKTLYPLTFQRVPLGLVIRNVPISNAPIKGEMSREPGERLAPAFSASGQDVWMPEELAQLNNPALVISAVGARCGKVFKQESNEPWGVVANTAVYSPGENSDLTFLWYQVNDENFWVRGGSAQPYVQFDRSLQQRIFLPPLETQQRIANYLDRETAEIDAAVADLDKYMELLEVRRRVVITQAVLGVIGPGVGQSAYWDEVPLHTVASDGGLYVDGDWVESKDQDPNGSIRLTQLADVGDSVFLDKSDRWVNEVKFDELQCTEVHPGDLLIARMPDPIARCTVLPDNLGYSVVTVVDVAILRPNADWDNRFVMWAINSIPFRNDVESRVSGSTRQRISRSALGLSLIHI